MAKSESKAFSALEDLYFIVGLSKENNRTINKEMVDNLKKDGYVFYNRTKDSLRDRYNRF